MAIPEKLSVDAFMARYPDVVESTERAVLLDPVLVYTEAHRIEGDFSIDRMNAEDEAGSYVFLGDLEITGNLLNLNSNYGIELIVQGHTTARNIIAGGAFLYLNTATVPGVVLGHYNDGMIQIRQLACDLTISQDHHMNIWPADKSRGVSVSDFPNSGLDVFVDDIKVSFNLRYEAISKAISAWFVDGPWTDLDQYSAQDREYAILEGGYVIDWFGWVMEGVDAGAPAQDDRFARFAAHMRAAFKEAAAQDL